MRLNFYVRIYAGPRTETKVEVDRTSVNEKIITFKNGAEIGGDNICRWIEKKLTLEINQIKRKVM